MCNCDCLGTKEQVAEFEALLKENEKKKDKAMEVLQKTQGIFGFIPEKAIARISKALDVAEVEIYGIITFYSQFTMTPKAKYNIDVCLGTACYVLGSQDILDRILEKLGVKVGQMTPDGKWIVTSCRCLGCCGLAPAITINGEVYGKLQVSDVDKILAEYAD